MKVNDKLAMELWKKVYGDVEFAKDCFGTYICRSAYGDKAIMKKRPDGDGKEYDYSWNVDHIRPVDDFENEDDADFLGNYEPMHRENNRIKSNNYPNFKIENNEYHIVKCGKNNELCYGIKDANGKRIDWKGKKK